MVKKKKNIQASMFREQDHCSGNPPISDLSQKLKERKKLIDFAEVCKHVLFDNKPACWQCL